MAARNARNQEFITWNCNHVDVEENLQNSSQSLILHTEIPLK